MKTGLLHGVVPTNNSTRVLCVFCGVFIPKSFQCVDEHVNGNKHKENIELMTENGISFNGNILQCKPCKCNLAEDESVSKHIDKTDHSTWMVAMEELVDGEFLNLEPFLSSDKEEVLCEACNCDIVCSLQNMQEHVNSIDHRTNVCEKLKPLNGIFPTENIDEVWCKVCNAYVDNEIQSILGHIDDDEEHTQWFDIMEDLVEDHHISMENFLLNEHEDCVFCKKCQVEIVCDTNNIEEHIVSESHINNIANAIVEANI